MNGYPQPPAVSVWQSALAILVAYVLLAPVRRQLDDWTEARWQDLKFYVWWRVRRRRRPRQDLGRY